MILELKGHLFGYIGQEVFLRRYSPEAIMGVCFLEVARIGDRHVVKIIVQSRTPIWVYPERILPRDASVQ